ncbi:MAG TPA: RluA family pseudouridine synthase, partial [Vicinamibacteria bacterium]|nr:RluA family pseudouridine synthase [Vicinamibacteria bacterium]
MPSSRRLRVEGADAGSRLDAWAARQLPDLSRARIQALIRDGAVLLDGRAARSSARLRGGEEVTVEVPDPVRALPAAEDLPLDVVFEDDRLLVLDKPAGMAVHPGAGRASGTLVNALLHRVRDLSGIGGVLRPGIVHRLDRGTSGLMVVAKDDESHRALAAQFASREVEKEYLAVVHGVPRARQGVIESAIGRDPVHRKKMSVRAPRGRSARSSYTVVEALDGSALLRVRIHTGRTHQIRVHLASLGHPVAGDATYGGARTPSSRRPAARDALAALSRPALHAGRLAFVHPGTGRRVAFESPLPRDLADLLERLRP